MRAKESMERAGMEVTDATIKLYVALWRVRCPSSCISACVLDRWEHKA